MLLLNSTNSKCNSCNWQVWISIKLNNKMR